MSEPTKSVDIAIRTTADTTGAEEAAAAIQKVEDAADNVTPAADGADESLKKLVNLQRAQVAQQIGQGIAKMGSATRSLSNDLKEADKELSNTLGTAATVLDSLSESMTMAAQGFAVGGPAGAAIGAAVGLMLGKVKAEYEDMVEAIQAAGIAEKNSEIAIIELARARAKFAAESKAQGMAVFFKAETDALDEQSAAIERNAKVAAAARAAEMAVQSANTTNTAAGAAYGAKDANLSQANAQTLATEAAALASQRAEMAKALADIDAKVTEANAQAVNAQDMASTLQIKANELANREGSGSDAALKAATAASTATQAAEQSQANADAMAQIAESQKTELLAKASEAMGGLKTEVSANLVAVATEAQEFLEAESARVGGNISSNAKAAMDGLAKVLADGIIKPEEMATLNQAIMQMTASGEARNSAVLEALRQTELQDRQFKAELSNIREEMRRNYDRGK